MFPNIKTPNRTWLVWQLNNNMKKTILTLFCLISICFQAQSPYFHSTYSWEKTPVPYQPSGTEKSSDLVIVFEKRYMEIAYDSDGQAVSYEIYHKLYHVNSAKAVDEVNKGYMSTQNVLEEIDLRARTIAPDGKVTYFNTATVKSVDNLEGNGPYKIFAIDGVESGCDVEVLQINKKQYQAYSYYFLQARSPIHHYETHLIAPLNLVYDVKTYNGLNAFKEDKTDTTKNHWYIEHKDIPAVTSEKYSAGRANYMGYIFQLSMNTNKKKSKIYTWDIISRDYYNSVFTLDKNISKSITKFIGKNKLDKGNDPREKIRKLDALVKTEFEIGSSYGNQEFQTSIETKKMDNDDAIRLYIGVFKQLQIPFELILGAARDELKLDPKFPSYIYTRDYVFYFPELDEYLSPLSIYSRLGFPDPSLQGTECLFIKEVNIGDISSSTSKIKPMGVVDYKKSQHNMAISVAIHPATANCDISVTHLLSGYSSYYIQPIYRYLNDEQKKEVHEQYYLTSSTDGIKDFEVLNTSENDLYVNPMLVKYKSTPNDFVEMAGNKLIFKVGLTIGQQSELYQEEKRSSPGDIYYTHLLERTIEIEIPAGYNAINLDDLKIKKTCLSDSKEIAVFSSDYEIKNNVIVIKVYEDYQSLLYPLTLFDNFKAVINAAADFNKKTIIFEKL